LPGSTGNNGYSITATPLPVGAPNFQVHAQFIIGTADCSASYAGGIFRGHKRLTVAIEPCYTSALNRFSKPHCVSPNSKPDPHKSLACDQFCTEMSAGIGYHQSWLVALRGNHVAQHVPEPEQESCSFAGIRNMKATSTIAPGGTPCRVSR